MAKVLATPGVYIEEKSAFSTSAVPVATAMPAFIGYTEKAVRGSKSLLNVPTKISSLGDYHKLFGGSPTVKYTVSSDEALGFSVAVDSASDFKLYNALKLFYANGGGSCYIVSVGDYSSEVKASDLSGEETGGGLTSLLKEPEPTMILSPDAILLSKEDFYSFQSLMLMHCGKDMQSRIAILDVYDGDKARTLDDEDVVTVFREGVGQNFLSYGAAYYPWVNTTVVKADELSFDNIANLDGLVEVLTASVSSSVEAGRLDQSRADAILEQVNLLKDDSVNKSNLHNTLSAISPLYKNILKAVKGKINLMTPAAAMAGVYAMVDSTAGVQKAPANVSMGGVVSPAVNITNKEQEDLNLPLNGKAVNAIRTFPGKGTLVWGARTLDGNSQDWRYINVRRVLLFVEQTIKYAAEAYVFEPNTPSTWGLVNAMISNALIRFWSNGVLTGSTASEAFDVACGLGVTMTEDDILDGIMRISVRVAVARPAEFIVITFQQKMAGGDAGGDEGGEE